MHILNYILENNNIRNYFVVIVHKLKNKNQSYVIRCIIVMSPLQTLVYCLFSVFHWTQTAISIIPLLTFLIYLKDIDYCLHIPFIDSWQILAAP